MYKDPELSSRVLPPSTEKNRSSALTLPASSKPAVYDPPAFAKSVPD